MGCLASFPSQLPLECVSAVVSDFRSGKPSLQTAISATWAAGCCLALAAGGGSLLGATESPASGMDLSTLPSFTEHRDGMNTEEQCELLACKLDDLNDAHGEHGSDTEATCQAVGPMFWLSLAKLLFTLVGSSGNQ